MSRVTYEIRIREKIGNKCVKKSKFYAASSPREARERYGGSGYVMWIEKVSREKLLGIGEFFTLGSVLLKEFSKNVSLEEALRNKEKRRVEDKRFLDRKKKLASE